MSIAAQGGWKLDFRDPTMDRRVVEFCLTVPLEQFVRGGKLRSLVRRAMAGRLPETTLNRMQRGQQSADWYESLTRLRPQMLAELETAGTVSAGQPHARSRAYAQHAGKLAPSESLAREQEGLYHIQAHGRLFDRLLLCANTIPKRGNTIPQRRATAGRTQMAEKISGLLGPAGCLVYEERQRPPNVILSASEKSLHLSFPLNSSSWPSA